ncbi:MAG: phasin family protein [Proteobacteria bacterium]|nr:phasin family protein [Pseudomonadota bacterium]
MPSKKTAAKPAKPAKAAKPAKSDKSDKSAKPEWMARIKDSSHDVFLAGLASLARARTPGKRSGKADFDTLVSEGRKLEPDLKGSMQKTWEGLREKSRGSLAFKSDGRLQEIMEGRVATALTSLGVPSRKDFDALTAKVDSLLEGAGIAPRAGRAGKSAPRKTSARKTASTKAAAGKKTPAK